MIFSQEKIIIKFTLKKKSKNPKNEVTYKYKKILEEQLVTKVQDFKESKSYLKNNGALRRSLNYDVKTLDYEYNLTSLSY